jgi:1-acyl-sn-glycerol-3-phosphate acyltransferase
MKPPHPLWKLAQVIVRVGTSLLFDLKVYGKHNVPAEGGALMISNHQSLLDPAVLGAQLPRPMSYIAKSELWKNRVFGGLITRLYAFPVRQGAGDVGAIKETISRLHEGHLLNIYPVGSRTEDGELLPIQAGAALVIRRAGVPVVPAVVDGSFYAWPKGRLLPTRHPVRVMYGKPLKMDHMKSKEIVAEIDRVFREMLAELRTRDPELRRRRLIRRSA